MALIADSEVTLISLADYPLPIYDGDLEAEKGVPENASDVAICQAIVGIAHSLGLGVVAEGIEREEQRQFLTGLGIELGQGFLFSEARPPAELAAMLRQRGQ